MGADPDTTRTMTLDFKDADIRDILRAIGDQFGLNIIVDQSVEGNVTVHLHEVPVLEGLDLLLKKNGFRLEREGNTIVVNRSEGQIDIEATQESLSIDVTNAEITAVLRVISQQSGINIVSDQTVRGPVSGMLHDVEFDTGLASFLSANGYLLRKRGNVYEVSRAAGRPGAKKGLSLTIEQGLLVSLDVSDADIADVLDEIALQTDIDIIRYGDVRGLVNAKLTRVPLEQVFRLLFQGTNLTYRKVDSIYLIGDKSINSPAAQAMSSTRLIPLRHIKAEGVLQLLPQSIPAVNVRVVKEQNAILVMGTDDLLNQAEEFIEQIDLVSPQVMFDAVIAELSEKAQLKLGMRGGYFDIQIPDTGRTIIPTVNVTLTGEDLNERIEDISDQLQFGSLGRLPEDFALTLQALETSGDVTVRSRPRIATLNGNQASIDVGTVQWYRTTTGTALEPITQLHSIDVAIRLNIIPWVSHSGDITTVLHVEISNITGITSEGLPEVGRRVADTTIRLQDGETIIIGGLSQSRLTDTRTKIPLLGDLPLVGILFSSWDKTRDDQELVIYITPHIINGK
jgi:type IV pilus assembly protein PilQ